MAVEIRIPDAGCVEAPPSHATQKFERPSDRPVGPRRSRLGRPHKFTRGELKAIRLANPGVTSERHVRRLALAKRVLASLAGVPGIEALTEAETPPTATLTALGSVVEADRETVAIAVCMRGLKTDAGGARLVRFFARIARRLTAEGWS